MRPLPDLLLLLFTAALLLLTYAMPALSATRCPNCGSTPVPYPFSTGSNCGDQSYKIRCDAGTLMFDTLNNSYPITSINPSIQRLVIRPASLLPNTCVTSDFVNQGIQMNSSLPFNITGDNTIMYLNCTESLLRSPLNCSANSLCQTYVNDARSVSPCQDASICCTFKAGGGTTSYMIRVREAGCMAYTSFVNLDPSLPVGRWPSPGVAIQWVLPQEPLCVAQASCDRNSTCGPDPLSTGVKRCFCNGGLRWDPIQGICVESK